MASLRYRADRDTYMVDFRDDHGVRRRVNFGQNKRAAERLKKDLEAKKALKHAGIVFDSPAPKVDRQDHLESAIYEYFDTRSKLKTRHEQRCEKSIFKNFNAYCLAKAIEKVTGKKTGILLEPPEPVDNALVEKLNIQVILQEIDQKFLEGYQTFRVQQASPSTVNRNFVLLRTFFGRCFDLKMIDENPCAKIQKLREKPEVRLVWTDAEFRAFNRAAHEVISETDRDAVLLFALTGARPVELQNFAWSDVDWENKFIRLHSQKNAGDGSRLFPMYPELLKKLTELYGQRRPRAKLVLEGSRGATYNTERLQKCVRRAVESLKLRPGLSIYGLRHMFATRLSNMNVNQKKIQSLMGHASIKTTERYTQQWINDLQPAASDYGQRLKLVINN